MKIESYQTIKPEYQEIITQLEKVIDMLNQSVMDKYNTEYVGLHLYNPREWLEKMREEQLLITEGVRKIYVDVLNQATEHCIVVKFQEDDMNLEIGNNISGNMKHKDLFTLESVEFGISLHQKIQMNFGVKFYSKIYI